MANAGWKVYDLKLCVKLLRAIVGTAQVKFAILVETLLRRRNCLGGGGGGGDFIWVDSSNISRFSNSASPDVS